MLCVCVWKKKWLFAAFIYCSDRIKLEIKFIVSEKQKQKTRKMQIFAMLFIYIGADRRP